MCIFVYLPSAPLTIQEFLCFAIKCLCLCDFSHDNLNPKAVIQKPDSNIICQPTLQAVSRISGLICEEAEHEALIIIVNLF